MPACLLADTQPTAARANSGTAARANSGTAARANSGIGSRCARRRRSIPMPLLLSLGLAASLSLSLAACGASGREDVKNPTAAMLGVNGYLWQATLDTLSFMPIQTVDPAAAIILTDWYSLDEAPNERVQLAVRFLSDQLRSDSISVSIVRQERRDDRWMTVPSQATTVLKVEEAILTQARQLYASIEP